jgi:hypothetical protein
VEFCVDSAWFRIVSNPPSIRFGARLPTLLLIITIGNACQGIVIKYFFTEKLVFTKLVFGLNLGPLHVCFNHPPEVDLFIPKTEVIAIHKTLWGSLFPENY